ncbi:hypothetical protein RGQ29_005194 [Quercus rubra]|uniref:B box-type domain-containing protein n=1 Tax=Quercus rubra TaxID=3512 RepID=A0AAN7IAE0_QUERU|nr:hypothetical protein RGQ29_005194 [Quercus rubra]
MKIQCDVCDKEGATVFCPADEAALCDGCDNSIHHANKLASKHTRFSLVHPSSKEFPLCDICQERRAILFCKEDRAILCKECDLPIHKANEHTQIHNRFLLTGVKLSASSSLYPTSSSSTASDANVGTENRSTKSSLKRPEPIHNEALSSPSSAKTTPPTIKINENENSMVSISTSSISEYLMETLPGWRVEDFLDPSSANYNGFCKSYSDFLPSVDQDLGRNISLFPSAEGLANWVPQVSPQSPQFPCLPHTEFLNPFRESEKTTNVKRTSQKWSNDAFTVPQISSPCLKKPRHFR